MKKFLLTLLAVIVVAGVLAGAGYAGYRFGYNDGVSGSGKTPILGRFFQMNPARMPMHDFGDGFDRGFNGGPAFNHHPMMRSGGFNAIGFSYFSPFMLLWRLAIIGLIIWFAYWLFTKSGWQITRKPESVVKTDSTDTSGN